MILKHKSKFIMKNKCKNCGKCCIETEMILSQQDIDLIIRKALNQYNKNNFVFKNSNGHFQLKNLEGRCVFYNLKSNICRIYEFRPQGCRFYPLIYDFQTENCVFDNDCPRTQLFYEKNADLKKNCKKLKIFLKNQLKIEISEISEN